MDHDEAMRLLRGGVEGINEWNRRRGDYEVIPDLTEANLFGAHLEGAHLEGAHLEGATFDWAHLEGAHLAGAHLEGAHLTGVHLFEANLFGAHLNRAMLAGAHLAGAHLEGAHLAEANLSRAHLAGAHLEGAHLTGAILAGAYLEGANLSRAHLDWVSCNGTIFTDVDLSQVEGLDSIKHHGPSHVSTSTLIRSQGNIPRVFLHGCGLTPWEVLSVGLYDPAMTPPRAADLQYLIFDAWTKGRGMINGCFISHSWKDATFVDTLHDRLVKEGVNVWLDRHDMVAGPIQDQVWRAIQLQHVVLLVLSKDSTQSDWVENELDMARSKEKAEGRAVLCPVALDDAWKSKVEAKDGPGDPSRQLWRTLQQKLVVDFSQWESKAFEEEFRKLLTGLKLHYGPVDPPAVS